MSTLIKSPLNGSNSSTQNSLSSWVDNLFENGLGTGFLSNFNTGITLPAVNIKENAEDYVLELAIPGMKKSDFNIDIDNKVLSISTEIETENEETNDTYTRREFGYSSFKRTFSLPDTVESEQVKATYENGILCITLPKREEAKQKPPKRIEIS
ncbi:Hsp20/alpha crystallin family protein [uncultured Psychroserpens sp.]|uniref:Hsp20/alpha crystallin family protein n=1 Tax=uncultured Psychroserpens sp. TaxID=255436 RepID=UPI0026030A3D|nr:Hsp20/alpha crystallin family protein [uncultured Psychroserpens sp.]